MRKSPARTKTAKSWNRSVELAALPADVPLPGIKPKNFNAKLAGLNSLKRNYHAYLNSNSPRMAAISAFVARSASSLNGRGADALLKGPIKAHLPARLRHEASPGS